MTTMPTVTTTVTATSDCAVTTVTTTESIGGTGVDGGAAPPPPKPKPKAESETLADRVAGAATAVQKLDEHLMPGQRRVYFLRHGQCAVCRPTRVPIFGAGRGV